MNSALLSLAEREANIAAGERFLQWMQDARNEKMLQATFGVVEVAWGRNIHNRDFDYFIAIENAADRMLREWGGISISAGIGVLAELIKVQNPSITATTVPDIFREYFAALTVA